MSECRCCIFAILFGADRDLAARSLRSYRRHAPAATVVAACVDGPTPALERTAAIDRIDLIELPELRTRASWSENPFLTAMLARFIDVPPLLPLADVYLMVDADTICLRPLRLEALWREMTARGKTFAAAPEVNASIGRRYLTRCRRIFDAFYLPELGIDPSAEMVNVGVVAWPGASGDGSFIGDFAACLQYIAKADALEALDLLPCAEQAILNVLAQRHAGGRFHLLHSTWNERRAFESHSTNPDWPAVAVNEDAIIWHCRDSFEALWAAYYPEAGDGLRPSRPAGDIAG